MENIYEQLAAGKSAREIADEFTAALNEAEARIAAEEKARKAAEEAAREAERHAKELRMTQRKEDLKNLFTSGIDFLKKYYSNEDWDEITDEDLNTLADAFLTLLDLEMMTTALKSNGEVIATSTKKPNKSFTLKRAPKTVSADDAFASFFKSFGL